MCADAFFCSSRHLCVALLLAWMLYSFDRKVICFSKLEQNTRSAFFFFAGLLFHWFMEGTGSQVASLGGSRILNGFTNSGNFAAGGINAV